MDAIGTITVHFSYVDEETRAILQSVMNEAQNYGDFAEKLCDRVCMHPSPPLLEYLAVFFAYHIDQKTAKYPSMRYLNDLAISMFPDIIVA
ncbi:MAG: hypothetical protein ACFFDM_07060 [Candidatus Thorarchaeota archaeon]